MNLDEVNTLIDKASKVCGSDNKLAQHLEVSRSIVSDWRHGRKRCAPEDIAVIADLAGLDAPAWAARAMVWRWEGTPKGDRLMRALGKSLLATGAALGTAGASAANDWIRWALDTMYRKVKSANALQQRQYSNKKAPI